MHVLSKFVKEKKEMSESNQSNKHKSRIQKIEELNAALKKQNELLKQNLMPLKPPPPPWKCIIEDQDEDQDKPPNNSRTWTVLPKATQTCIRRTQPDSMREKEKNAQKTEQTQAEEAPLTSKIPRPGGQKVESKRGQRKSSKSGIDKVDKAPRLASVTPSLRSTGLVYENANFGKQSSMLLLRDIKAGVRKEGGTKSIESGSSTSSSVQTVISGKSGDDIRDTILSQIKLQEQLKRSIKNITRYADHKKVKAPVPPLKKEGDGTNINEALATAKDVITCNVMAPIIRRLQRLYQDSLQEKLNILKDMERVPELIDNIYRTHGELEPKK